jgi:type VI secretion system secreted protein VgrG
MATTTKQGERLLSLTTPLGEDVLLLEGFSGSESLSRLFTYQLDLLSEDEGIKPADIVGKNITWHVDYQGPSGKPRYFNGYVSKFTGGGAMMDNMRVYHAEVVPWLWFLTRTTDCRIFQNLSVPDIIKAVFADMKGAEYAPNLTRTYSKREYCVQYRETDFNFVSRLMEQEGIFYWFKHEDGKHTLIAGDQASAYVDCVEKDVSFSSGSGGGGLITSWDHQYAFRSGKWTQTDYNFETPKTSLLASTNTIVKQPGEDAFELYDYPGEYMVKADGTAELKVRMEEEETPYDVVSGGGGCITFTPGSKFNLKKSEVASEQGAYVITSVRHEGKEYGYSDSTKGGEYSNTFTCIPAKVTFRPPRRTPKSIVQGPQTAVVVGPKGEEIYTDKYGRIKVQFFWDRYGKKDENSSCWMRVAQVWAGKRWGASFWPRIGQEVVVDFLEGDPDRPLIVGSVYNADQMPPYQGDGPDTKHPSDNKVCGVKSNSTKGGDGYNEWRFDDSKGAEQIFVHAERDMDERVNNDSREIVLNNRHLIVGNDKDGDKVGNQLEMVYQDKHLHIHRNQIEQISGNMELLIGEDDAGGNLDMVVKKHEKKLIEGGEHHHVKEDQLQLIDGEKHLTVGKNSVVEIGGLHDIHVKKEQNEQIDSTLSLTIGGDRKVSIGANDHVKIKGDRKEKLDGNQSLTVGGNQQEKVAGRHALDCTQEIHLKAGTKLILEAGAQLTIKGPGGFVDIGPSGVTIQGIMVLINSGGSAGSGSGSSPDSPDAPGSPQQPQKPIDAKEASPTAPAEADESKTGYKSAP